MRVFIDALVPGGPKGRAEVKPKLLARGVLKFDPVGPGVVRLKGHVEWVDAGTKRRNPNALVRAFVNGFQQPPVDMQPGKGDPNTTPFEATLLLRQKAGNRVSLLLDGEDASDAASFSLDCRNPVSGERVHVLVVGGRGQRWSREGPFGKPPFAAVVTYPPLSGNKTLPGYLYSQLQDVKRNIRNLTEAGEVLQDVVIIYYQGHEDLGEQGNVFTPGPGSPPRYRLACDELVKALAYTPGAHVLLLDLERDPGKVPRAGGPLARADKVSRWPDEYPEVRPHVGVVRYAWAGKGAAPARARLSLALEEAIPKASRLNQLVTAMGKVVAAFTGGRGLLVAEYVPKDLEGLVVGRAPVAGGGGR
jgi:hypothetical protein